VRTAGRLRAAWAAYRASPTWTKHWRYFAGSVITTVVSFAALTVFYGLVSVGAVAATLAANAVATVPAYWLNRTWTWGRSGRSDPWREMAPFWVSTALGVAFAMLTAAVAAHLCDVWRFDHLVSTLVVNAANLAAYAVGWVVKYVIFDRLWAASASGAERAGAAR